jgi:hypothetical protein
MQYPDIIENVPDCHPQVIFFQAKWQSLFMIAITTENILH